MKTINGIKIHKSVFTTLFPKECIVPHCKSICCEGGAWIDIRDRDKILQNKELFKKYLRKEYQNESMWFENEQEDDEFPSGRCVEISEPNYFCVFFDKEYGCVLQKAARDAGRHEWEYKSFACILFPLTIEKNVLRADEELKNLRCGLPENGRIPIYRACEKEIRYLLGDDFYRKIEEMAKDL